MSSPDLKSIALRFNDCINNRNLDGLADLMTDDHKFIDSAENAINGKGICLDAWRGFFSGFPDYKNVFESVTSDSDVVLMAGYSTCSEPALDGRAIWTARIVGDQVSEWRVYDDTPEIRQHLGVD